MGFVIFEQSGTFIPSNYGLVTGDPIQVVVVGGGGGGHMSSAITTGTAGGTSSFGSYFSATGGTYGGGHLPATTTFPFMQRVIIRQSDSSVQQYTGSIFAGGFGDDGWLPQGVPPMDLGGICSLLLGGDGQPTGVMQQYTSAGRILRIFSIAGNNVSHGERFDQHTARTDRRGGNGFAQHMQNESGGNRVLSTFVQPCGGLGYGAGGGGLNMAMVRNSSNSNVRASGAGGGAGAVVSGALILPGTANITVTVGSGGAGAYNEQSDGFYAWCGGGASGCVAVFW